ncbi:MAG TPA: DUF308 domain-containing protein [Parafilimonas sp.]|nr:DUF308 domain-containing protein [Parafilimonas sp.]
MQILFRKWWVILIQGILLIVLSIYVFSHPGIALASLALWLSILILIGGFAGLLGWWLTSTDARETSSLLWSIGSIVLGLVLLVKTGFTMQLLATLVGIWMIVTGGWLMQQGWSQRRNGFVFWVIFIPGLFSLITGLMAIFNKATGATAVSIIVGIQLLLAGIALVVLAFVKRKIVSMVNDKAAELRNAVGHS